MIFKYKTKISFVSLFLNLIVLSLFFVSLINPNKYGKDYSLSVQAYATNLDILTEEISDGTTINVNNIYLDNKLPGVIYYIVQPNDTLSEIANNFGVTVSHIKKINHLKSSIIKPGQKLTITDQNGIVYISKGETVSQLAKKFDVSVVDILESNSLQSDNYKFEKGDEVFIPMSDEKYKKWLMKNKERNFTVFNGSSFYNSVYTSNKSKNIVKKYWYKPNIYNGFYKGHCTRFVAIKKFPYITKNKQKKLWNGNAKYWYQNAKKAGYSVGKTPKNGAIVVIKVGGRHYYYAGHVGIVKQIDWKNKRILIEEMNAVGKYIVTWRWIPMDSKIIGYIYL